MKKHIANVITGGRIAFSLPLLFLPLSSAWFYVFYLFCGFTDMIDGTIARRMGAISKFGARLDTIADFVFMLVCGAKILPIIRIPVWLWMWIAVIALAKIFGFTAVLICKKKFISIHSVLNKITGVALFLFPLTIPFVEVAYSTMTICALATIAATQEIYFALKGREVL